MSQESIMNQATNDYRHNQQKIAQLMAQLNQIVLDKPEVVKLALSGILAGGDRKSVV